MIERARRRWKAIAVAAVALVIALNVLGLLRYPGGPLREPSADGALWLDIRPANQGSNTVGNSEASGLEAGMRLQYGLLSLGNTWPWPATVEAVTPIDGTPGLVIDAAYMLRPGAVASDQGAFWQAGQHPDAATIARDFTKLPAEIQPTGGDLGAMVSLVLLIHSDTPGAIGWSAIAVDYRVGPFAFRVIQHDALHGCLNPLPSGVTCAALWPEDAH